MSKNITRYEVGSFDDIIPCMDGYLLYTDDVIERVEKILKMYPDIHDLVKLIEELR